jgi:NAD(P)-dependent dehydrogenase (short-subunit alcohol dehydrogenase family)
MSYGRFDNPVVAALAGLRDIFSKGNLNDRLKEEDRFDGKTCLVTGANSGLGYALAVELARRGGHVIMACRRQIPEAGESVRNISGSDRVEMRYLDLSMIDTMHSFVQGLVDDGISLDVVILNAGVALPRARKTASGLDEIFLVNYLSNVMLMSLLLQHNVVSNRMFGRSQHQTKRIPRIIFISSDSHRGSSAIDWDEFGQYFDYGVSKGMNNYSYYKLVLNTYAVELSRRLNAGETDVSVYVICPGPVNTNIIREAPWILRVALRAIFSIIFKKPEIAARAVVYMAGSPDYEGLTGQYLHMFNAKRMDEKCYDSKEGEKLWRRSMEVWDSVDHRALILP